MSQCRRTAFTRLNQTAARLVLVALMLAVLASVVVSLSPLANDRTSGPRDGAGDVALYRAEIERIRAGQSYYAAVSDELPQRGYPSQSVFNWRTPLPMAMLGGLPDPKLGQALLALLATAVLMWGFSTLADEFGLLVACIGGLLLAGVLLLCVVGDLYVMPVLWSGVLMALSLCGYARNEWRVAVAAGILAALFRELALPYVLMIAALAFWRRQWRELAWWIVGLTVFACFYTVHITLVREVIRPDAVSHENGWVRFGGWAFVLSAAQIHGLLLVVPHWVTAIYLPLAVFGLVAWQTPAGQRFALVGLAFLVGLSIVGQSFNQYWGALVAPLWCFGAAIAPLAIADLLRAAGWLRQSDPLPATSAA